ncbi:MAG: hypothetical protein V7K98_28310 [Nostoc sp.]
MKLEVAAFILGVAPFILEVAPLIVNQQIYLTIPEFTGVSV